MAKSLRFRLTGFCYLAGFLLLASQIPASAQLQVDLQVPRSLFIRYEPILVVVSITNLSGRPILLEDQDSTPWFGFQIEMQDGRPVQPRSKPSGMDRITIGAGETLRRQVNLTPLFSLDDFGRYRVRATVFDTASDRFFSSRQVGIEMTDGRTLWQQTVGHPEEGTSREIAILAHRLTSSTALYVRIRDPDAGRIFCTHRLGPLLIYGPPQVEIDRNNQVHVLHLNAPRSYIYSHVGLNGEVIERKALRETKTKPVLVKDPEGFVVVTGGAVFDPSAIPPEQSLPAVSDRPVPLPGDGAGQPTRRAQPAAGPEESPSRKQGFSIWPFRKKSE